MGPRVQPRDVPNVRKFEVPAANRGTYRIDAVLHYRKIDQFLLNYVLGEKSGLTSPVADIASATATVTVGSRAE